MPTQNVLTIRCWLPDLNSMAAGCVTSVGVLGAVLLLLVESLSWATMLLGVLGVTALVFWFTHTCVTVTAEQLTIIGCGLLRRPRYTSPLAELALAHRWALSGSYVAPEATPTLSIYTDWDMDTPSDYVIANYRGEQITSFFCLSQYADIQRAVAIMADQPGTPGATITTVSDDHA